MKNSFNVLRVLSVFLPQLIRSSSSVMAGDGVQSFLYFAFGSNLLSDRIHINNPSAKFVDIAKLEGFHLDFNYFSQRWQGATATVVPTSPDSVQDHVWGVLWRIEMKDLVNLDKQEGVCLDENQQHNGLYKPMTVSVVCKTTNETVEARTYQLMKPLQEDRRPSKTYLDVIKTGAREHSMPQEYLKFIDGIVDNGNDKPMKVLLNVEETKKCE